MSRPDFPDWLAFDVGGANIKAAHSSGQARTVAFELWKQPEQLPRVLEGLATALPAFEGLVLTMTAELCDCYATKDEGVVDVVGAAMNLTRQEQIFVWGIDGRFHDVAAILTQPRVAAAANWLALAEIGARFAAEGPGLLIDVGSTTTDVIPLRDRRPVHRGRSDTERLRTGELIYAGVRRTPVGAVAPEVVWRDQLTGLAAEFFASTHDVYLMRGEITPDPSDVRTADGRPATKEAARDRLARMVGADRETFSEDDALELARAVDAALLERLVRAARRAIGQIGMPRSFVISGSGLFLARRLAESLSDCGAPVIDLGKAWGPLASEAACAHALLVLAAERLRSARLAGPDEPAISGAQTP
jgi:probable H4MPT-linked C1 transfer pathway protein